MVVITTGLQGIVNAVGKYLEVEAMTNVLAGNTGTITRRDLKDKLTAFFRTSVSAKATKDERYEALVRLAAWSIVGCWFINLEGKDLQP